MRKYWWLDAQFTNLLHLADDIPAPALELWRRITTLSALAQMAFVKVLLISAFCAGIYMLLRGLIQQEVTIGKRLLRAFDPISIHSFAQGMI